MSQSTSLQEAEDIVQRFSYWTRAAVVLQVCVKEALLDLIHHPTIGRLPRDPEKVFSLLFEFKRKYENGAASFVNDHQWKVLCHTCSNDCGIPDSCPKRGRTATCELDITCLAIVVRNLNKILVNTGFRVTDLRPYFKLIGDACYIRNTLMHNGAIETIDTRAKMDLVLADIKRILTGLKYQNMDLFENLVALPLDCVCQHAVDNNGVPDAEKLYNQVLQLENRVFAENVTKESLQAFVDDVFKTNVAIERRLTNVEERQAELLEYIRKLKHNEIERNHAQEQEVQPASLESLSKKLKIDMHRKYERVQIPLVPSATTLQCGKDELQRDDIIVNLSLLRDTCTAFALATSLAPATNGNRIQEIREKQRKLSSSEVEYKDIVSSLEDYIVITGGPGCGKTTLVETLVYKWSTGTLWHVKPKFDFVFIIYLREIGKFREYANLTAAKLISLFYPHCDLKSLQKDENVHSLLILEGFDELYGKEKLRGDENNFSCYTQAIYDLLNPNNPLLPFTRIVTTRPNSCPILYETMLTLPRIQTARLMEITGFSESNIDQYVLKHFSPNGGQILQRIKQLPIIHEMMVIPFYCWGICYLLKNDVPLDEPGTTYTALFSVLLSLFIRKHGVRNHKIKLKDLLDEPLFKETCLGLAQLAFKLEENGKISFTSEDLPKDIDLERLISQSGMIMEIENDNSDMAIETTASTFQFVHYSFHEFLVALHMFVTGITKIASKSSYITSMLAGLMGGSLANSRSPMVVRQFARLFTKHENISIDSVLQGINKRQNDIMAFSLKELCSMFYEYQNPVRTDLAFILIDDAFLPAVSYDRQCQVFFRNGCQKKEMMFGEVRFVSRFARDDELYLDLMKVCRGTGKFKVESHG